MRRHVHAFIGARTAESARACKVFSNRADSAVRAPWKRARASPVCRVLRPFPGRELGGTVIRGYRRYVPQPPANFCQPSGLMAISGLGA